MPVPTQESKRTCFSCVRDVDFASVSLFSTVYLNCIDSGIFVYNLILCHIYLTFSSNISHKANDDCTLLKYLSVYYYKIYFRWETFLLD